MGNSSLFSGSPFGVLIWLVRLFQDATQWYIASWETLLGIIERILGFVDDSDPTQIVRIIEYLLEYIEWVVVKIPANTAYYLLEFVIQVLCFLDEYFPALIALVIIAFLICVRIEDLII